MLRPRFVPTVVSMWLLLALQVASGAEQRLSDFRRVVLADNANGVQKAAAEELVRYVGRLAGNKLEVISWSKFAPQSAGLSFFVGADVAERILAEPPGQWKQEEWLLRTVPQGLVLAGDDGAGDAWSSLTPAGSMLALYTLLEDHLGVHWFWPGPFGEHVPNTPEAVLPHLEQRSTPELAIRSIVLGYTRAHTEQFHQESRRWMRRSRLGWVRSAVFGHSWEAAFNLRSGQDFAEHPEWFALVNGRRRPPQMCTTDPAVIERMVEYVLAGKNDIMNISPSDGGGFCECERCQALDVPGLLSYDHKHVQLSDRIFTYANEVARRVRARNPDRGVGMFAYTFYNRPPVRIERLEPNLYLSFVYQSAAQRNAENLREWRESVAGWRKLGAKLVMREGWGNHYYFDLPFLHYRQILANFAEARQLGFMAAYGEGSKCFATQAPNYWAITRMMWHPARDTTNLMREYYEAAYGPAAREMEAYWETYNRALDANWPQLDHKVDTTMIAYANIIGAWRRLLPEATVAEAGRHLDAAARVAPPGEYAERVQFHRFGHEYTAAMLDLLECYRQLDLFKSSKSAYEMTAERQALLKRAYELGERREEFLLAHRDWAGPDEGLYAYTNDAQIRTWHKQVQRELGIDRPSSITTAELQKHQP